MEYTMEEVLKYIEEEDVKFIRLAFRDAYGVQKNISVMPGEVKKAFEDGIQIGTRAIAGFADSKYSSLYLKPDPDTMAILPWRPDSGRVLRMFCDVKKKGLNSSSVLRRSFIFLPMMMKEIQRRILMTMRDTWI